MDDDSPVDIDEESTDIRSHVIACRHRWRALDKSLRWNTKVMIALASLIGLDQVLPAGAVLTILKAIFGN